ncbi:hypothetical protein [Gordonia oryzae]|uniref:hypothetical protein n=1 Tax=Gordonia oryzae TaxID=2487349 RepID=UPI001FE76CA1|nr:hypothetical protein [Gordonia oryzae]
MSTYCNPMPPWTDDVIDREPLRQFPDGHDQHFCTQERGHDGGEGAQLFHGGATTFFEHESSTSACTLLFALNKPYRRRCNQG